MKLSFEVKTDGLEKIAEMVANHAEESQVWLANEVLKDTDPYVPALTGSLSQRAHTEGDTVIYPGPYARYLYYGKVVEGPKYGPKYATDKDLVYTKSVHPNAQPHWFEASKAQNLQKWIRGVKKLGK